MDLETRCDARPVEVQSRRCVSAEACRQSHQRLGLLIRARKIPPHKQYGVPRFSEVAAIPQAVRPIPL